MIDVRLVDPEKLPTPTSTPETSEDESDDPDDPGMTEIRYVPDNSAKLQDMFKAMSTCQVSLNDKLLASQCVMVFKLLINFTYFIKILILYRNYIPIRKMKTTRMNKSKIMVKMTMKELSKMPMKMILMGVETTAIMEKNQWSRNEYMPI